jgi:hypothetical protein
MTTFKEGKPIGTNTDPRANRLSSLRFGAGGIIRGVIGNFSAQELQFDPQTGSLVTKSVYFNTNIAGGPTGTFIEDFIHYQDTVPADGTPYSYGLVKLHNSSYASYWVTPSATDPGQMSFRIQGMRNIVIPRQISSYYFEWSTKSLIYGDGLSLYNATVKAVISPTTGKLTGVDITLPTLVGTFNHTSFSLVSESKYLLIACSSCNNQLGMIRVFQNNETITNSSINQTNLIIGRYVMIQEYNGTLFPRINASANNTLS